MKKFILGLLILSTLLSLTIICNATLIEEELIDIPAEEEIMPMCWDGCGNNYNLPDNFLNGGRWSDDFDYIAGRLNDYHGVSIEHSSEMLHKIKKAYALPANYNCIFSYTGDVYNQYGEYLGSLITG